MKEIKEMPKPNNKGPRIFWGIFIIVFCIGAYKAKDIINVIHSYKADSEKVRQVKGKIVEKKYVPMTAAHRSTVDEQFILIYTNNEGSSYKIDDSRLYGKAEKGDSVIVFYNYKSGNQPNFLNIKKF